MSQTQMGEKIDFTFVSESFSFVNERGVMPFSCKTTLKLKWNSGENDTEIK